MKIASRHLLPLEMFLAIVMVSWGLSGWFGGGPLARLLAQDGLNDEFGAVLCGIGALSFALCALEWFAGKRWSDRRLLASVTARYWLAFVAVVIWLYVLYLMVILRGPWALFTLASQAPAAVAFLAWIFVANRKTACILDPNVPTDRLEREILEDRGDVLRGR